MKIKNKSIVVVFSALSLMMGFGSCTDQIAFGDKFLDKAPGGDATIDTVFNNAEYTRQFLVGAYSLQYYGLPYQSSSSTPLSASYWTGKFDALSDCYQLFFSNSRIYSNYYEGMLTASSGNASVYGFLTENNWEMIRAAYMLIDNIGRTPDMEESEKLQLVAEAKCLIASAYFNMFKRYGGLPIVTSAFPYTPGASYNLPRASVEHTVDFMVNLCDQAATNLPWKPDEPVSETGRWTKAGAMALKCKILQFAASPLFNSDKPYYDGSYTMDKGQDSCVWYGNYSKDRWTRCLKACQDFFNALSQNGYYELTEPTGKTSDDYRLAFRNAYVSEASTEVILGTRSSGSGKDTQYFWTQLTNSRNERYSYCPTEEFIEMFPWADGRPFNWDETQKEGKLDYMFIHGDSLKPGTSAYNKASDKQMLVNRTYTRDPRLYETVQINGDLQTYSWNKGATTGNNIEAWVNGSDAGMGPQNQSGYFASGYGNNKYVLGTSSTLLRKQPQWVVLSLNDMILTYAEALLQANDDNTGALEQVNKIRARVGLGGLAECNPSEDLKTNKANLLEEILRERACELAMSDSRYFDLIRYKRADKFAEKLHGLQIYRLAPTNNGKWTRVTDMWWNGDKKKATGPTDYRFYEPSHFDFERVDIKIGARTWWKGFDVKWYLEPFPQTEVNKGYGLTQNPGW